MKGAVALLTGTLWLSATAAAFSDATLGSGSVTAGTGCDAPGSVTVEPSADAEVQQGSSSTNNGTATTMRVQASGLSANMRSLVKFTLPSAPSTWCTMTAATLRLNASAASTGRTLGVYRLAGAWTETGVTWANQPATTGTAVTAASATGWVTWTVTTQVAAMYSGTNNGFLVRDQSESGIFSTTQTYATRENASNRPQLVVTWG